MVFCSRQLDSNGKVFHYQFGETGGLLTREDNRYFDSDSISIHRASFQDNVLRFSDVLSECNPDGNADGYLRIIASKVRGKEVDFKKVLKGNKVNGKLIESSSPAVEGAQKFLKGAQISDDELKALGIFVNLFKYVDISFIECLACGNFVKLSWGWLIERGI